MRFPGCKKLLGTQVGESLRMPFPASNARSSDVLTSFDSVNTAEDFEPLYVVPKGKKKIVRELKSALKGASQLLLATDEDRVMALKLLNAYRSNRGLPKVHFEAWHKPDSKAA